MINITWHGGPDNNALNKNTVCARFNEIIEVPDGTYNDDMRIIQGQIIFRTKRKHKLYSVRAFINNQEYPTFEAKTIGYDKGYHFFIPASAPVGYMYIKYYPSLESEWISGTPIEGNYLICDNRPAVVHLSNLSEIRTAIDLLDSYIATTYTQNVEPVNKRIYYEDYHVLLNDYTHVQIKTYQSAINDIRDSLKAAFPDWNLSYTFTPINSNLMLSNYISEIRYAINTIRDRLNA